MVRQKFVDEDHLGHVVIETSNLKIRNKEVNPRVGSPGQVAPKVVGLIPKTVYWMDFFNMYLLYKLLCLFEKTKINEKEAGMAQYLNKSIHIRPHIFICQRNHFLSYD